MQKRSDIFLILLTMCRWVSAVGKMHNTALCEHIVNSQHAWGLGIRQIHTFTVFSDTSPEGCLPSILVLQSPAVLVKADAVV